MTSKYEIDLRAELYTSSNINCFCIFKPHQSAKDQLGGYSVWKTGRYPLPLPEGKRCCDQRLDDYLKTRGFMNQ